MWSRGHDVSSGARSRLPRCSALEFAACILDTWFSGDLQVPHVWIVSLLQRDRIAPEVVPQSWLRGFWGPAVIPPESLALRHSNSGDPLDTAYPHEIPRDEPDSYPTIRDSLFPIPGKPVLDGNATGHGSRVNFHGRIWNPSIPYMARCCKQRGWERSLPSGVHCGQERHPP
ncbi:hypothetical protein L227DRAFT_236011 [Lentinus tigrinus ALCF2SS1-6]|uniref:Uncharacterized protein n=1 Tax=Lentinus tigrinus ALCF2SS1-6 TaxID=1328759 RepID=A0A5C2S1D1_9APHY|nr:hypothetical protein L227DRAFT_236011 [Lentinus tigrinus ALCF2SS1-6]